MPLSSDDSSGISVYIMSDSSPAPSTRGYSVRLPSIPAAAQATGQADHVLGALGDDGHLLLARAHVGRGHVAPAERLDELPERPQLLGGARHGVADHDGLAPAERQARQRGLARHGRGKRDRVTTGREWVGVGLPAAPTQGRPEHGRVDRHDHLDPAGLLHV